MKARFGLALGCLLFQTLSASAQDAAPLPNGAVVQLGGPRLQVSGDIVDCAFTPDKRGLIVVHKAADRNLSNVVLFDVATGLQRKHFDIHEAAKVVVAKHKPLMAVVTMHAFEVWDLDENRLVRRWPRPDPWYKGSIAISPDGSQVIVSSRFMDPTPILRFDVATGDELSPLQTRPECQVSFSPDGKKIFTVSATFRSNEAPPVWGRVGTWDAVTGKKLAELEHRHDYAVVAPDGRTAALGSDGRQIRIVDLISQDTRATFDADYVDLVFTPDSKRLVIAVPNSPPRLWDIAANKEARVFEGSSLYGLMPRISPDGRLLAAFGRVGYNRVQFWEMASGKLGPIPQGHPGTVSGVAFAPDGRQLASCSSDTLLIFDLKSGSELRRWVAHQGSIDKIVYSPNGKLLASLSADGTIALWDPATGELRRRLAVPGIFKPFAFSRDGASLITVSSNRMIEHWDVERGTVLRRTPTPDGMPAPLLSATGEFACFINTGARGGQGQEVDVLLRVMDIHTAKMLLPIANQAKAVGGGERPLDGSSTWGAACSIDGKLIATSDVLPQTPKGRRGESEPTTHAVRVWETASRREILRFADSPTVSRIVAISPDSRILAHGSGVGADKSSADHLLVLSDIFGGQPNGGRKLGGHLGAITSLAFSADSQYLATGGADHGIFIWPVKDFLAARDDAKRDAQFYWPILADADAGQAYWAIGQLERQPQKAVAMLRRVLKAEPRVDDKAIAAYVCDLDSASYLVRQKAFAALERAGDKAAQLVRAALVQNPTLEAKRRLEMLVEKLTDPATDPRQIRAYRCVTLLERIGTADARRLLEELSQGVPSAWLTVEAGQSLRRYSKVDR